MDVKEHACLDHFGGIKWNQFTEQEREKYFELLYDYDKRKSFYDKNQSEQLGKGDETGSAFYCQRDIEGNSICKIQCDHCKAYYKPLEVFDWEKEYDTYFAVQDIKTKETLKLVLLIKNWIKNNLLPEIFHPIVSNQLGKGEQEKEIEKLKNLIKLKQDHTISYLKSEYESQMERLDKLGIPKDQFFEQRVNALLRIVETGEQLGKGDAISFADWIENNYYKQAGYWLNSINNLLFTTEELYSEFLKTLK